MRTLDSFGYMPEDRRLVPQLTAQENIMLPAWVNNDIDVKTSMELVFDLIPELTELADRRGIVLATGGGAIERVENRQLLIDNACVIYLYASLTQQCQRTQRDRKRPLLQGDNPREVLALLLARRDPLYRAVADIVVTTDHRGSRAMIDDLAARIRAWPGRQ